MAEAIVNLYEAKTSLSQLVERAAAGPHRGARLRAEG
jgi:hypothetical protein